ncbi:hypothetical protein FD723_39715 (plasmid) [Nostoc sp. C052]|uniref:hypothetical protein n=1 Tax=Nostoc sp. C052 TaxID=2576902 RepID=UPI0015C3D0BD|nr:hypothetical protein [Nostoc sp. C052]QLE46340.1 hypothetical protein FD723_39715 [Nostoc sp. C052]
MEIRSEKGKPKQQLYIYNQEFVAFSQLPKVIQEQVLIAEEFWDKVDAAANDEERRKIFDEHPYNQPG